MFSFCDVQERVFGFSVDGECPEFAFGHRLTVNTEFFGQPGLRPAEIPTDTLVLGSRHESYLSARRSAPSASLRSLARYLGSSSAKRRKVAAFLRWKSAILSECVESFSVRVSMVSLHWNVPLLYTI